MAYTLTQARPLLTAAELELFNQSRAEHAKRMTPADLAGAVKRTRTLRDKYRDLFRRQTVAVRGDKPGAVTGDDNDRTQRKADILQEVLERYEARAAQHSGAGGSKAAGKGKAADAPSKPATQAGADLQGAKRAGAAAKKTAKGAAPAPEAKVGAQAAAASKTPVSASTAKGAKALGKTPSATGTAKKSPVSVQLNTLAGAGASVAAAKADPAGTSERTKAGSAPARSPKAPSRKAPTAGSKANAPDINAPLDTVPSAKRASPLKKDPGNMAIHAHQSSSGRRTQGKRDSR